jgi:WD40 repeat protein
VASAAKNGAFKLWDLTSGRLLHQVSLPRSVYMTALCFNPSEFILAAATTERVVVISRETS